MENAIFDWNTELQGSPSTAPRRGESAATTPPDLRFGLHAGGVEIVDETLRDGLQNGSGINPPIAHKIDLLHAMAQIGVDVVSVGLPAAGARYAEDTFHLCREIATPGSRSAPPRRRAPSSPTSQGIARASERAGIPIEVYSFIGSSPIRHYTEGWDMAFLVDSVRTSTEEAVRAGLPVLPRDRGHDARCTPTPSYPLSHGDRRGRDAALPLRHDRARDALRRRRAHRLHPRRDRGAWAPRASSSTGTLTTIVGSASPPRCGRPRAGVDRVHGTGLGVGERVGNTQPRAPRREPRPPRRPGPPSRASASSSTASSRRAPSPWTIPDDHPIAGSRFRKEHAQSHAYRVVAPAPHEHKAVAANAAKRRRADRLVPMTLQIGGIRGRARGPPAAHPARGAALRSRPHRHQAGLRQGRLRRLHRGRRRRRRARVPHPRARGRRARRCTTVESARRARPPRPAARLLRSLRRRPVRLLHAGHAHERDGAARREPAALRAPRSTSRISGNLCRCTGYGRIVDAVELAREDPPRRGARRGGMPGTECAPPPLPSTRAPLAREEPSWPTRSEARRPPVIRRRRAPASSAAAPARSSRRADHGPGPLHRRHPPAAHALGPNLRAAPPARAHRARSTPRAALAARASSR